MGNDPYAGSGDVDLDSIKKRGTAVKVNQLAEESDQGGSRFSRQTLDNLALLSEATVEANKSNAESKQPVITELDKVPDGVDLGQYDSTFYQNTPLDNIHVRKTIESRCSDISFLDLLNTGRVRQRVPISPGKFEITFQSLSGADVQWIGRHAAKQEGPDWALRTWAGYAKIALAVASINGGELPDIMKDDEIDMELFNEKYNKLLVFNEKLLDLILVNFMWFEQRVEKIIQDDLGILKNG